MLCSIICTMFNDGLFLLVKGKMTFCNPVLYLAEFMYHVISRSLSH